MKCRDFENWISGYLDGELTAAQVQEMDAHMAGCPSCGALLAELGSMDGMLRESGEMLPDEAYWGAFDARLKEKVDGVPAKQAWWDIFSMIGRPALSLGAMALLVMLAFFTPMMKSVMFQGQKSQAPREVAVTAPAPAAGVPAEDAADNEKKTSHEKENETMRRESDRSPEKPAPEKEGLTGEKPPVAEEPAGITAGALKGGVKDSGGFSDDGRAKGKTVDSAPSRPGMGHAGSNVPVEAPAMEEAEGEPKLKRSADAAPVLPADEPSTRTSAAGSSMAAAPPPPAPRAAMPGGSFDEGAAQPRSSAARPGRTGYKEELGGDKKKRDKNEADTYADGAGARGSGSGSEAGGETLAGRASSPEENKYLASSEVVLLKIVNLEESPMELEMLRGDLKSSDYSRIIREDSTLFRKNPDLEGHGKVMRKISDELMKIDASKIGILKKEIMESGILEKTREMKP
jgi:anti-sigma factor RsiW